MILPSKHIPAERSLLGIGGDILSVLEVPRTVSETWVHTKAMRADYATPLTFDWFVLSLSWLYTIEAVEYKNGILRRRGVS